MSDYCPCFADTGKYGCEPLGTCRPSGDGARLTHAFVNNHLESCTTLDCDCMNVALDEAAALIAEIRASALREAGDYIDWLTKHTGQPPLRAANILWGMAATAEGEAAR